MLVLSRRTGENLLIGDDITITVLGLQGNQVRLGIDAPKSVKVHREEVYNRIKREQAEANNPELEKALCMICPSCGFEGDKERLNCPMCWDALIKKEGIK